MAHQIHNDTAMMYVGEMPWHGLGTKLPHAATWEKAREVVGFYRVTKRPLLVDGLGQYPVELDDKVALVREDTGAYLSVVGRDYGVVQFDDMAETVMRACGGMAVFHTAGLLGERGARGWLLGEVGAPIRVKGDESEIRKYFLATAAHTGNASVVLANVATRVVCANTLGVALGEKEGARWSIRHTSNAADRVQAAGVAFAQLVHGFDRFEQLANLMAQTRMTDRQMARTVDALLPTPVNADGTDAKVSKQLFEKRELVSALFDTARGIQGIRGTAWGCFQAWTQWADHHMQAKKTGAGRLDSIWFGRAAEVKRDALQAIMATLQPA